MIWHDRLSWHQAHKCWLSAAGSCQKRHKWFVVGGACGLRKAEWVVKEQGCFRATLLQHAAIPAALSAVPQSHRTRSGDRWDVICGRLDMLTALCGLMQGVVDWQSCSSSGSLMCQDGCCGCSRRSARSQTPQSCQEAMYVSPVTAPSTVFQWQGRCSLARSGKRTGSSSQSDPCKHQLQRCQRWLLAN